MTARVPTHTRRNLTHMTTLVTDKKGRPVSATVAVVVAVLTFGYMFPWLIAALRGKSNHWGIFWLNLLLGWTIVGWVAGFVMSVMPHRLAGIAPPSA